MTTNDVIDSLLARATRVPQIVGIARTWAVANGWWALLATAAAALSLGMLRRRLSMRTLRARDAVEVLPTTGFDPGLEEVLRFAKQIADAQRSTSRWVFTPIRGTAMRVRLMSDGGPLTLRLEGPARAVAVLRHQGYVGCELRAVTDGEAVAPKPGPTIHLGRGAAPGREPGGLGAAVV
jgi:hypothetical protein